MSIVVLRGSGLEIKFVVGFFIISTQIISKWQSVTLIQKRCNIPTQIGSQILKPFFCVFLEALRFEVAVPQLLTLYMDLHPPTHVQLKIPMVDV
jgi:hypothetical protein